ASGAKYHSNDKSAWLATKGSSNGFPPLPVGGGVWFHNEREARSSSSGGRATTRARPSRSSLSSARLSVKFALGRTSVYELEMSSGCSVPPLVEPKPVLDVVVDTTRTPALPANGSDPTE